MIKVLFFAKLREQLGINHLSLEYTEDMVSVASLQRSLAESKDSDWTAILADQNIIRAVNQVVVDLDHPVRDGDEVAFFPPVTGG
jgi:molybdopterin synthase sulfur carrier subunit